MQAERQTADNADADAAAASDEHVRRLQSQLQSTAEQLVALGRTDIVRAVVEQVVGVSGSQAVEPGQPGQPAATTAQPGVPRYVVPPATGDLAFGSSHWDGKPAEIHALILKAAGPLTLFVNGILGDTATLDEAIKMQLWTDALKVDWQGDLDLLPDVKLTADNGLLLAHSRSMYDRLCERFPQHTETECAKVDARNNNYDDPFDATRFDSRRLLLIPMRHGWFDLVDFTFPITLARMAIRFGCLDLLKLLDLNFNMLQRWMAKHDVTSEYWHTAVDQAARYGHLDVVQYLFDAGVTGCTTDAMDSAAAYGHLHVVKWLHANRTEWCTKSAMNDAAAYGHLHVVKWLHENRTEGCTTGAMDDAAAYGQLHVVKWLHENRTEGCTSYAMDWAAMYGNLHVVKWLHENRTEGCTTDAMDGAADYGHLHVVQWLHANRTEGCTKYAMVNAAGKGHLLVVQWLHETRGEECTPDAFDAAISKGHVDVVKYMHSKGVRTSSHVIERMAAVGDTEMLRYWLDCGYAVELGALERAKTSEIADILFASLTLDRAQALLAEATQGDDADQTTIEELESTIQKLQASSM